MLSPRKISRQMVRDKSVFGETDIGTSEELIGRGANARLSGLPRLTLIGMTMLGRVSLHFLMRATAITREMITTVRVPAVAAAGGLPLFVLPQKGEAGTGLGPHTVSLRTIGIADPIKMGHRAGVSMIGTITYGINKNQQSQDRRNEEYQRQRFG